MTSTKTICFCANRPEPKDFAGGGSGVMKLLEYYLDISGIDCNVIYLYKNSNKYNFVRDLIKLSRDKNVRFICHEPDSAAVLSALHIPYRLIYHQQGPLVQEYKYLNGEISSAKIIKNRIIEKLALSGADRVHFPSLGAEKLYFESKYATCKRDTVRVGSVLYNTIVDDLKIEKMPDIEKRSDCLTILSVGTVTELKGQDLSCGFIDKFLQITNKKVRWITVGKGPILDDVILKCRSLMEAFSNFEHIHYSALPHSNILYLDTIADVYLMLHRVSIFDLATLEAMSNGCMLILSNVGGNVDLNVEDNCILVDCGDMDKSAELLDKCDIEELKYKNQQVFERRFSPNCFVKSYRDLIKECIS